MRPILREQVPLLLARYAVALVAPSDPEAPWPTGFPFAVANEGGAAGKDAGSGAR